MGHFSCTTCVLYCVYSKMAVSSIDDLKSRRMWTGVVAELMGTALLVIFACGAVVATKHQHISVPNGTGTDVVQISLAFGFTVASVVWAIANVSGGHINPAVTGAFMVTRRITIARGVFYIIAQTVGAILGAAILKSISPDVTKSGLGQVGLSADLGPIQGCAIEFLLLFIFVFVIFSAVDGQRTDVAGSIPLTVGITISVGHFWAASLTGAGMNPARSLGPAVILRGPALDNHWIYWVGPLLGGMVAGLLYEFVFAVNASTDKFKAFFTKTYNNDDFNSSGRIKQSAEVNGVHHALNTTDADVTIDETANGHVDEKV